MNKDNSNYSQKFEIREYIKADGECPFREWLDDLDGSVSFRVDARLKKIQEKGQFGDNKFVDEGVKELRFRKLGGGIRIYYAVERYRIVVLLCGGTKRRQQADIEKAICYWRDYQERKNVEKK